MAVGIAVGVSHQSNILKLLDIYSAVKKISTLFYKYDYTHRMSKRLQVILSDEELEEIRAVSELQNKTVSELVRQSIRAYLTLNNNDAPEKHLAKILSYAKYNGPIADIDQILAEIERGKEN